MGISYSKKRRLRDELYAHDMQRRIEASRLVLIEQAEKTKEYHLFVEEYVREHLQRMYNDRYTTYTISIVKKHSFMMFIDWEKIFTPYKDKFKSAYYDFEYNVSDGGHSIEHTHYRTFEIKCKITYIKNESPIQPIEFKQSI